ncbi:MAG: response regulator, partial [Thaumarchaeota archaeon]|nr:response regulator [Nitrososphaerota archaeon]
MIGEGIDIDRPIIGITTRHLHENIPEWVKRSHGYTEELANNVYEVIGKTINDQGQKHQYIIIPMHPSYQDDFKTFEKIKKISSQLPVIMITAHSSVSLAVEFMKVGGSDFVEKPIGFEILEMKIQMALEKANLQAKLREAETAIQAAKQASQLKSVFISSISHELRTPLNAIVVYIQSLQMKLEDNRLKDKQLKEALKAMNDSSKLLTELINDVLDFSKIEAGKMQVRIGTVDLKEVTDNLCSSLSKSAAKKGLTLQAKIPDNFPLYIADRKMLK